MRYPFGFLVVLLVACSETPGEPPVDSATPCDAHTEERDLARISFRPDVYDARCPVTDNRCFVYGTKRAAFIAAAEALIRQSVTQGACVDAAVAFRLRCSYIQFREASCAVGLCDGLPVIMLPAPDGGAVVACVAT
jgi:hypothetical protein